MEFSEYSRMFGHHMQQIRRSRNLTQEQVAERLGVTYQAVSKWENQVNTPDIALLPEIAALFGVTIDALFSEHAESAPETPAELLAAVKDDDVIRVIQMRGTKVLKVTERVTPDAPPIEIAFPHDCNDRTQYFQVRVYGHLATEAAINGDVICHQTLQCADINGDVRAAGDVKVHELTGQKVICRSILDCYRLHAGTLECSGPITATTLECEQLVQKPKE
jgi:transcriptional regulator with XRE-family HTH domain